MEVDHRQPGPDHRGDGRCPVEHQMGPVADQRPVLPAGWLALTPIDHHQRLTGCQHGRIQLPGERESPSPSAVQSAASDQGPDPVDRRPGLQAAASGLVLAEGLRPIGGGRPGEEPGTRVPQPSETVGGLEVEDRGVEEWKVDHSSSRTPRREACPATQRVVWTTATAPPVTT